MSKLISKIIKDRTVVEDDWQVLRLEETDSIESVAVPAGRVIVPLKVWLAHAELKNRSDLGDFPGATEPVKPRHQ